MKKSLKILLFILLFISFILLNSNKTFAADKIVAGWYKTQGYYNMRKEGETKGTPIEKIPPGSTIHVLRQDSKLSDRVFVEYKGKQGSILSANLIKTTAPTSTDSTTATTTSSKTTTTKKVTTTTTTASAATNPQSYKTTFQLAMRNNNGKVIKSIPKNSIIQVIKQDPNDKNRVIATYQGKTGSIANSGLVKLSTTTSNTTKNTTKTTTTNTSNTQYYKTTYSLVMRPDGKPRGTVLMNIPAQSTVEVIKKDSKIKNRLIVKYNGKTGSIINSGLIKINDSTSKNSSDSSTENFKYYAYTTSKCTLSYSSGKTKKLGKNELIKVISISGNNAKVEWYGKIGSIPKKKIKKTDNAIFISIEKQTLTLIRKGKIIVTTPVVTGKLNKSDTTKGAFKIQNKKISTPKNPVVLKGTNYNSPVDYWMPFNNSIGIHDASWREENGIEKYGGEIYKTNGSHGCVNTPLKNMAKIYHYSYVGLAVYVQ